MANETALSLGRTITVDTTGGLAMSLDAHYAMLAIIAEIEDRIDGGETVATIASGAKIKVHRTGRKYNNIHVFDMYGTFSAGTYSFEFVETVANSASAS